MVIHIHLWNSPLTWIRGIYVELAQVLGALGEVERVGIGEEYVHVQLEAPVRDPLLQRRWKRAGVKGHQHLGTAESERKQLKINEICLCLNTVMYVISIHLNQINIGAFHIQTIKRKDLRSWNILYMSFYEP